MTESGDDIDRKFIVLDPRGAKRGLVCGTISSLGTVSLRRFPPLGIRAWPQTAERAEAALQAARTVPKNPVAKWFKRTLFALQYNGARALFSKEKHAVAVAWNGLNGSRRAFMDGARDAGAGQLFFELAPLPGRITVDPCGVNFENGLPRKIAPYLKWFETSGLHNDVWRAQSRKITARKSGQEPVLHEDAPALSQPFLFVPLQVPGDSQLRLFGGIFKTVEAFIEGLISLADTLPQGWHIRLKEHPTSPKSFSYLRGKMAGKPIYFDNATDTFEQVAASRGVLTVNSSVGLEAMFFDKPVVACGQCFWAVEGVAQSAETLDSLKTLLSDPQSLYFGLKARNAFLSFLTEVYYPKFEKTEGGVPFLPAAEAEKVRERLTKSQPPHFWGIK